MYEIDYITRMDSLLNDENTCIKLQKRPINEIQSETN